MHSKWAKALGQDDEDTWWCSRCVKYHWGECWVASKDSVCKSGEKTPWCETCGKRHYGTCWLLKGTKKGKEGKGTGSTDKGADDTGKGKSTGSTGKSTGSTGKGTGSTDKSTGSAGSELEKDGRNAIWMVYRNVKLTCLSCMGGSQVLAPRIIAMVRAEQKLEHLGILEVLTATETYLQQVQSTRLSIQTIMDEWMAKANYIQKDRLEEFVTYALPRMMEEAAEFAPSWQQEATAMAVTQAWRQQVAATASTTAWQQPVAETWSTHAWQQPEAEPTSTGSGKDQAQTAAVTIAEAILAQTAQTEEVESRLARSTRTNQKLVQENVRLEKLVQENVRLEKEFKRMSLDSAEKYKKMEQ